MTAETGFQTFHATGGQRAAWEMGYGNYRTMRVSSHVGPRHGNVGTSATVSSMPSVATLSGFAGSSRGLSKMAGAIKPGYRQGRRVGARVGSIRNQYGVTTPGPTEALPPPLEPPKPHGYGSSAATGPFWKAGPQSTFPGAPSRSASFLYPGTPSATPTTVPKTGIRNWAEQFSQKPKVQMAGAIVKSMLE